MPKEARPRPSSPGERDGEPKGKLDQILAQLQTMTVSNKKIPKDISGATAAAEERANKHTNKEAGKVREEVKHEIQGRDKQVKRLFDILELHHRALERCLRTVNRSRVLLANWGGADTESVLKDKIEEVCAKLQIKERNIEHQKHYSKLSQYTVEEFDKTATCRSFMTKWIEECV